MIENQKISIYRNIIQYLLDSTAYPIHKVANLCNSSTKELETIRKDQMLPKNSKTEVNLLNLFTTVIDMELKGQWKARKEYIKN